MKTDSDDVGAPRITTPEIQMVSASIKAGCLTDGEAAKCVRFLRQVVNGELPANARTRVRAVEAMMAVAELAAKHMLR